MKKTLVVLLIALVACCAVFAKDAKVASVGLEGGYPSSGITANFDIGEDFDVYTTLGCTYGGVAKLSVGAQYNVASFYINDLEFDVLAGAQVAPMFGIKSQVFSLAAYGTAAISHDFTVRTDSAKLNFNAFIRAAVGYGMVFSPSFAGGLDYGVSAGLLYKF